MLRMTISALLLVAAPMSAIAQERVVVQSPAVTDIMSKRPNEIVRINVNVNFQISAAADLSDDAEKARENARRAIYEMAKRECVIILELMAQECRLESVNVNFQRQTHIQWPQGYAVNGSISLRAIPK